MEWSIDNFSQWNEEVHGNKICVDTKVLRRPTILYPRHLNTQKRGYCIELQLESSYSGTVSFFCPDDILIFSVTKWPQVTLITGPTLEEVISRIRKTGRDRLTLRWFECDEGIGPAGLQHIRTTLEVVETCIKIDPKDMMSGVQDTLRNFSSIRFPSWLDSRPMDYLRLYSRYEDEKKLTHFFLRHECPTTPGFRFLPRYSVRSSVNLVNSDGFVINCEGKDHLVTYVSEWKIFDTLKLSELAQRGLTLLIKIKIVSSSFITTLGPYVFCPKETSICTAPSNNPTETLSKDLMCLYQDRDFSDFEIHCEDKTFPAHKSILSARSPVFKRLLLSDMKEAGSMAIDDLDAITLSRFLEFLYTANAKELDGKIALKLYHAADKYQVLTLKKECLAFLCADISLSNVCDILSLADRHRDIELTSAAHNFILKNLYQVFCSKEWASLEEGEPVLARKTESSCRERMLA